jgi:glycosyltransferase involved in cell wall biosynthesis
MSAVPQTGLGDVVAVIIPCYNAGHRIRPVAEAALLQSPRVLVVDDGSTDGCIDSLNDLPVQVLTLPENRGKGHALLAGFRKILADPAVAAICMLDADGQHDPAEIPRLAAPVLAGEAAFVIGVREFGGSHVPLRSRFGNRVTAWVTRLLLRRRLPDTQCGFRVLSRSFALRVLDTVAGGRYETEMAMIIRAVRDGVPIDSVPIQTRYEPGNASSHFRKFQDSFRIYRRLLAAVLAR